MAAKAKSRKKSSAPSSGKLPLVFGVVTVVILLIVGWVLVVGPSEALSLVTKPLQRVVALSGEAGQKTSTEELHATIDRLEKRIREMEEAHRAELKRLRVRHEDQLDELRFEINLLQDENKRLQNSTNQ